MQIKALPFILLLGMVFGTTLLASRFGIGQFHAATYVGLRLVIAGLMYSLVYLLRLGGLRWPRDLHLWRDGVAFGVFGTAVPMMGIVMSLMYQSSGVTSLLITIGPALTVLAAHFWLPDEHLSVKKSIGVLLALGGAALLVVSGENGLPNFQETNPLGYMLVLVGILSGSVAIVFARRNLSNYPVMDVASIRIYAAILVVVPLSLLVVKWDFGEVDNYGWLSLLFAAVVGTFFGVLLEFSIVKRFGAIASVMAGYVIPVIATLGGALFLGEVISWGFIGIMGMILAGVYLVNQG